MISTLLFATAIRLFNPHDVAVDARVSCGSAVHLEPRGVADVPSCEAVSIEAPLPLMALETDGSDDVESQRLIGDSTACGVTKMFVLQFACRLGTATAGVPAITGATYHWSVEGAAITAGDGTPRVTLALGETATARVSATIVAPDCNRIAEGVIAVRDPLVIHELKVPASADVSQPVTIEWSYENGSTPASQMLTGDAFDAPVALTAEQRSFTFTPQNGGARTVELRASYAAMAAAPPQGRRRAVAPSLIGASCPSARATATLDVRGCLVRQPRIQVPDDVDPNALFAASVNLGDEHDKVQWTVLNATLLSPADAPRVELRAAASGEVRLSVRVERAAGCFADAEAHVDIQRACPVRPTAGVTYVSHDCGSATVKATFTGKPPFSGTWSDGTPFLTLANTLTHQFTTLGTYTIASLRDASCTGTVTSSAELRSFRPKVTLSMTGGSCTNGKLVAKFTGVPPFSGRWSDGETFTTNSFTLERTPPPSSIWVQSFSDAVCGGDGSNVIDVAFAPVLILSPGPFCQFYGDPPVISARFDAGPGPYTVQWSDGVKTTSDTPTFTRTVPSPTAPLEYYEVVRASTGTCEAEVPNRKTSVTNRKAIQINTAKSEFAACVGGPVATAQLRNPVPAGATIEWQIAGSGARIVSGQGTDHVDFEATADGTPLLRATVIYPDGACSTSDHMTLVTTTPPATIDNFRVEPATIKAGTKAVVKFTRGNADAYAIPVAPKSRLGDLGETECSNTSGECTATLTDTHGPGTVEFELFYSNRCSTQARTVKTTLTIVP